MKFLAAAVQMLASSDKAANLDEARRWVRAAAAKGARVIALPEVFIWRGSKSEERKAAEAIPGPSSQELANLARELGIYLLGGSILEEIPGAEKAYNTSLLFGPQGNLLASYRKIHLFDVRSGSGRFGPGIRYTRVWQYRRRCRNRTMPDGTQCVLRSAVS